MSQVKFPQTIVHIGMHKAASSYLQQNVFDPLAKDRRLLYLDPYLRRGLEDVNNSPIATEVLTAPHKIPYFMIDDAFRARIHAQVMRLLEIENIASPKLLISDEYLVGDPEHNFFMDVNPLLTVKAIWDSPTIILVVRRQDEFLESWYADQIRAGRWEPLYQVLNDYNGVFGQYKRQYRLNLDVRTLDYHRFTQHLHELFGQDNVHVVPFELLRQTPSAFSDRVTAILHEDSQESAPLQAVNRAFPYRTLAITRILNRGINNGKNGLVVFPQRPLNPFLRRYAMRPVHEQPLLARRLLHASNNLSYVNALYPIGKLFPSRRGFISSTSKRRILDIHKESNKRLAALCGLDLGRFGYY